MMDFNSLGKQIKNVNIQGNCLLTKYYFASIPILVQTSSTTSCETL